MKKLIAVALAFLPIAAAAIEPKEVAACAAKDGSVERLSCFDDLAARHSLAPSSTTVADVKGAGDWIIGEKADPLNDQAVYTATLLASSGKGKYGGLIALSVRCADNKTEMYINWSSYLGRDTIRTTYRIDKEKAQTNSWDLSTDSKAAFFPGSPITTLKRMADSTSFVANLTPYNESPVTAVFDTSGAAVALADIRKGCGW